MTHTYVHTYVYMYIYEVHGTICASHLYDCKGILEVYDTTIFGIVEEPVSLFLPPTLGFGILPRGAALVRAAKTCRRARTEDLVACQMADLRPPGAEWTEILDKSALKQQPM